MICRGLWFPESWCGGFQPTLLLALNSKGANEDPGVEAGKGTELRQGTVFQGSPKMPVLICALGWHLAYKKSLLVRRTFHA
jgi:hypothetical protein